MSDTKDKDSKGEIVNFMNSNEVDESLSSEQGEPQNQKDSKSLHNSPEETPQRKIIENMLKSNLWNIINAGAIVTVACSLFTGWLDIHDFKLNTANVLSEVATKNDINLINVQIDNNIEEIKDIIEDYENLDESVGNLEKNWGVIESQLSGLTNMKAEPKAVAEIMKLALKDDIESNDDPMWGENDIVATDENEIENITADELKGEKIKLSYLEDAKEIIFYGKYSENNKWDGDCTLNVYLDDKLQIITEAKYEDGKLLKYRQAYMFTTKQGNEVWCISKRECTENGNLGDSWNYYKDGDIEKDFYPGTNEPKILTVGYVRERVNDTLEGYYHGLTLNGSYNDDTGEAYLIKFASDGTVRTLYKGNFADGKFAGTSSKPAWMIGRKEEEIDSKYAYYEGEFDKEGEPDKTNSTKWKYELSYTDIIKYTSPYFFKCKLEWYGFEET